MSFSRIVTATVFITASVVGLRFVSPWYDHLRLKATMQEAVAQAQVLTDEAMISSVLVRAQELKVPLDRDSFT
jgi:hypothetical protein